MIIDKNLPKSIKVIGIINLIISIILILFAIGYYLFYIFGPPQLVPLLTSFMDISFFIIGVILLILSIFLLKRNNFARLTFGIFTLIISILLFLGLIGFASDIIANIQSGGNKAVLAPDQASLTGSIMNFIMFLLPLIFHAIEAYFLLINKKVRYAFKNK